MDFIKENVWEAASPTPRSPLTFNTHAIETALMIFLCLGLGPLCNSTCLVVSATTQILAFDFDYTRADPIISNLTNVLAIDYHFSLGYIFWSDQTEQNIKRSTINGANITTIINKTGIYDGLAVEWKTSQLYWTDALNNDISVSDLEGDNQRVLISSGLDEPRGIAVDPHLG